MSSRFGPRFLVAALALAALPGLLPTPLAARQEFPLAPNPPTGLTVSPFFEGWMRNPDGTYSVSLGYFNRNTRETLYIPRGPNNFIEPAEFDGMQPEQFPPRRVRGTFTVTVPAEYYEAGGRVHWTLINRGQTLSVPAGGLSPAYELGHVPMAMGSVAPDLRFELGGPAGRGPTGIVSPTQYTATVGQPLALQILVTDPSARPEWVEAQFPLNVVWTTHQGPAMATFSEEVTSEELGGGPASANVTFPEPGEYMIRVQADNFDAPDSGSGDQCCWTNGYFRVRVTP